MTSRIFSLFVFALLLSACSCTSHPPAETTWSASGATSKVEAAPVNSALTIASWNMKHLGRKNQNTEAATGLLRAADLITLQEVNSSATGQDAIMRLATQLRKGGDDRVCVGLSEVPSDGRERYGYLWKDKRVAYIKANGEVMESCPSSAITIRLEKKNADKIVREPAYGTFFDRGTKTKFVLASIHLVPSGKKPQLEVPPLFEALKDAPVPIVVAGDYNLDSGHSAFTIAKSNGFRAAFIGQKTSLKSKKRELSKPYDNFWYRGVEMQEAKVINLYTALPQIAQSEIYDSISDHCPVTAEFSFDSAGPELRNPASSKSSSH